MKNNPLPEILNQLYDSGKTESIDGETLNFHSGVSREEAAILMAIVNDTKAVYSVETGLACGASALAMAAGVAQNSPKGKHFAIDPNQYTEWQGSGVAAINRAGLKTHFELLEGGTHEVFHNLLAKNTQIDCAFIDGWHTFDYTLIDFFFIDKLLRPGGIVAFHDMQMLAKQKVIKFLLTHRDYEEAKEYRVYDKSRLKSAYIFVLRILDHPPLLFSKYYWQHFLRTATGLIVLRKKRNFEPPYNFFKNF